MATIKDFRTYCKKKHSVTLTNLQEELVQHLISTPEFERMCTVGGGKTTVFSLLERFMHHQYNLLSGAEQDKRIREMLGYLNPSLIEHLKSGDWGI